MAKRCSICTDGIEASGVDKCPKCQDLTDLGIDRIAILLRHAKKIPRRAERRTKPKRANVLSFTDLFTRLSNEQTMENDD